MPAIADFQLRVKPIAITMVVASTISTKHATNVAIRRPQVAAVTARSFQWTDVVTSNVADVSCNERYEQVR